MLRPSSPVSRAYVARRAGFTPMAGLGGLGPNLLTNPNGPYSSGAWSASALTETTGQTDPLGGSTASLLTDTAANVQHFINQTHTALVIGQKYQVTAYFKPGTFTGGISFDVDNNACGVNVSNTGTTSTAAGSPTNVQVVTVGGFFKLTFNFVATTASTISIVFFGPNFAAYLGTVQNQTFWGMSLQQVLP